MFLSIFFYFLKKDANTLIQPPVHVRTFNEISSFSDLKIGYFPDWTDDSDPKIRQLFYEAKKKLESQGAKFIEIPIPHLEALSRAHVITILTEIVI